MKQFISVICIYIFTILLIIIPIEVYNIATSSYSENIAGSEVIVAVRVSKTKTNKKVKKLILGDSTGHALYPSENTYDSIVSLACNQAITMAGHYFLLKNYIETNNNNLPSEIVMLCTPSTFSNNVDIFAYQYFLKPFPINEYKSLYTKYLYGRIKTIPFYWTANLPLIQTSNYTPRISIPENEERLCISKLSMEYLLKIVSITKEYNIPFKIQSTPVREDRVSIIENIKNDLRLACVEHLNVEIENYIQSIEFYPSNMFYDEVHLNYKDTPKDYLGVLN